MPFTNALAVVMVCDNDYVMPTSVAVTSLIENKAEATYYDLHVIGVDLTPENERLFLGMASPTVRVRILPVTSDATAELHEFTDDSFCVASLAALKKFEIPLLLSEYDRALYLDGDIIVRDDLTELFATDLGDDFAAVVGDSGQIYFKHKYVKRTDNYFNSGVMLLNLERMRRDGLTTVLIETKRQLNDSSLMDQNVFNEVFKGSVRYLPIKYNCLHVNLLRSAHKFDITDINALYGTQYDSLEAVQLDAKIVHFSSKDKPWKYDDVPLADEWYDYYARSPFGVVNRLRTTAEPLVSVVIPAFNVERYIAECLDSVLGQTLEDIEVICVDDGSEDRTAAVLRAHSRIDSRVVLLSQPNAGQSSARNAGIKVARGEYIYFLDGDDLITPECLAVLHAECSARQLDVVYFDGDSFFETDELRERHALYTTYYQSTGEYADVHSGPELFVQLVENRDYRPSPSLQFIRRRFLADKDVSFKNGIIHEDNLFSLRCILEAARAAHIKKVFLLRRLRPNSTMTSPASLRNFDGYFACMHEMFTLVNSREFSDDVLRAANIQITGMFRGAGRTLAQLPISVKAEIPTTLNGVEDLFLQLLKSQDTELGRARKEHSSELTKREVQYESVLKASEDRVKKIRASKSFRIGKAVTEIPRRLIKRLGHRRRATSARVPRGDVR